MNFLNILRRDNGSTRRQNDEPVFFSYEVARIQIKLTVPLMVFVSVIPYLLLFIVWELRCPGLYRWVTAMKYEK